jgi:undecaprenyl-diphosphatase
MSLNNYLLKNRYLNLSAIFFLIFLIILSFYRVNLIFNLDSFVSNYFISFKDLFIFEIATVISSIGSVLGVFLIVLFFSIYFYKKKDFFVLKIFYLAIFLDLLLVYSFKYLIGRIRPDNLWFTTLSFPSGHTTMGVVLFGFIFWYFYKKNKFISFASLSLLFLMGLSRIILNVHWFTDVLAGYFLGFAILIFSLYFLNKK